MKTVEDVLASIAEGAIDNEGYEEKTCVLNEDGKKICYRIDAASRILYYNVLNHEKKHGEKLCKGWPDKSISEDEVFKELKKQGFILRDGSIKRGIEWNWPLAWEKSKEQIQAPKEIPTGKEPDEKKSEEILESNRKKLAEVLEKITRVNDFINDLLKSCLWFVTDLKSDMRITKKFSYFSHSATNLKLAETAHQQLLDGIRGDTYKDRPIDRTIQLKIRDLAHIIMCYRIKLLEKKSERYLNKLDDYLSQEIPSINFMNPKQYEKLTKAEKEKYRDKLQENIAKGITKYIKPSSKKHVIS